LQDTLVLFKYYWYDTDKGIRVNPYHGMVEIHKRDRFLNINNIFVFPKQCQQVFYKYTPF
jgi:hypothetical protein